jgi:hypothetical protein
MKFYVSKDEWYPVYELASCKDSFYAQLAAERPSETVELTAEEYADYKQTLKAFNEWQGKIADMMDV